MILSSSSDRSRLTKPIWAGRKATSTPGRNSGLAGAASAKPLSWAPKDRKTNKIKAKVVENTDAKTLQEFVTDVTEIGATVYTDDAAAYKGMPFDHASVRHSVGEYVDGMAHTNGIESFWSMLKRAPQGRLPQDERQAPATVCGRVRGPP